MNGLGGHDATVARGGRGQFDVFVDGDLVFSKQSQGRFPERDEILAKL